MLAPGELVAQPNSFSNLSPACLLVAGMSTVGTLTVSAGRAFRGPRSARVDGTVGVLRSNQVGFSAFQISTTQRISPSGSCRQIVIPRPFIVTGMPSGPSIATSLRPSMYARLPSGENVTSVEVHVIRNPGIFQLDSTYSRNAGLPEIAGSPGGKTIASSVQYDRMRSMSRPFEETAAHSASRRSSSALADVKSNLDFPWERDDGAMTERITGDRFSVCPSKGQPGPGDNRLSNCPRFWRSARSECRSLRRAHGPAPRLSEPRRA